MNPEMSVTTTDDIKHVLDSINNEMVNVERNIKYRSFYFKGGPPKKKETNLKQNIFDIYDPRYYDDYIEQAEQYGFHQHILVYDLTDGSVKSYNFAEAAYILSNTIDWENPYSPIKKGSENQKLTAASIMGALDYFGKNEIFLEDYAERYGIYKYDRIYSILEDNISSAIRKLSEFIGQPYNKFDHYLADVKYAFDSQYYLAEYLRLEPEINLLKETLLNLLQSNDNVMLCTNNINGIFVGDVTLDQTMDCMMVIVDSENDEVKITRENTNSKSTNTLLIILIVIIIIVSLFVIYLSVRDYKSRKISTNNG